MRVKPWRRGEPITAARLNEMVAAVNAANNLGSDGSIQISRGSGGHSIGLANRATGIPIKNDNSGELPAYGVAYVKSIDTTHNAAPLIVVDKVGTTFKRDFVVNGPIPVSGSGGIGLAQAGPIITVKTGAESGIAVGESWGPTPSQWFATEGNPTLFTCVGSLGTGDPDGHYMLARVKELDSILGEIEANVNEGSSGTVYVLDQFSSRVSSWSIAAANHFADLEADASNKAKVICIWINGAWRMVAAKCQIL